MKELVYEIGEAISQRVRSLDKHAVKTPRGVTRKNSNDDSPCLGSLAKNNSYLMINKMIAEHPEFENIKNRAKDKVLDRVKQYKENVVSRRSSIKSLPPIA